MILLHGRGGTAAESLDLASVLGTPRFAALAPEARGHTWYPGRFTDPVETNEPYLSSALSVVADLIAGLLRHGLPGERIAVIGFSQGACLALECAARHPGSLGAVIGLSGGLIGASLDPSAYPRHEALPVLLACSDHDPHIPLSRVRETETVFRDLGAAVETRIHPGSRHGIDPADLALARRLVSTIGRGSGGR
jgi:predicted esterase